MTNHKEENTMNLKAVTALSAEIHTIEADIQKDKTEANRCRETMAEGDKHAQAIAELEHRREDILAQAFIDHTKPDTAAVDAEIKKAKTAREDAIAAGRVAAKALKILEGRIAERQAKLAETEEQRKAEVANWARAKLEDSEAAFDKAVEDIKAAVSKIMATSRILSIATGNHVFNTRADLYRDRLQNGLVCSQRLGFTAPGWLYTGIDISVDDRKAMREELEAAGFTFN